MATYYLDPTSGNDSNNGLTASTPKLTAVSANSLATSGDTIIILAGTHTMTTTTIDDFTKAGVTYRGQRSVYGRLLTELSLNGVYCNALSIGAASATVIVEDIILSDINTTNKTTASTNYVWRFNTAGQVVVFKGCIFKNIMLGSTNSQGYGSFVYFASGTDATTKVIFENCLFYDFGIVSGAVGNGLSMAEQTVNASVELVGCSVIFDVSSAFTTNGGAQLTRFFQGRDAGSLTIQQYYNIYNSILYKTSGNVALTNHTAVTTGGFNLDANYAHNAFYSPSGSFTFDAQQAQSISNAVTTGDFFVDVANQNFNPHVNSPMKGVADKTKFIY